VHHEVVPVEDDLAHGLRNVGPDRLPVRWPRWAPALPAYGIGSLAIYWFLERLARELILRI
jgi:hypothetical protein